MGPPQPSLAQVEDWLTRRSRKGSWLPVVGVKEISARVRGMAGSTLTVMLRTTPKAPAPAPRSAQKRSGFVYGFAVRRTPSEVTMMISRTRSAPKP